MEQPVLVTPLMSREANALVERSREFLDPDAVADLIEGMTAISSPTGQELGVATMVADHLQQAGVNAEVQHIEGEQANAVGYLGRGDRAYPRLLLYAALDTAFANDPAEDEPWLGTKPRADFALPPQRDGHRVIGQGAENPKAFAAAAITAVEAMVQAEVDFPGKVVLALVGGSMPVIDRPSVGLQQIGHGTGIRYLLQNDVVPDMAIVLKPGYAVSYEEVGLAWFRLFTRGQVNYTGIRHKTKYRNPIVMAARVIQGLEEWFPTYAAENGDGIVAPQASINAIRAGDPNRLAFSPVTCEIDVDVRVPPSLTPTEVAGELRVALDRMHARDPELDVEMIGLTATPGTRTDPDHWVVRCLIEAWEWRERAEHVPAKNGSGATDAALIRGSGIPTARIGLPSSPSIYDGFSMGVADATSVVRLAEVLIRAIVDTCTRTRAEIGLT